MNAGYHLFAALLVGTTAWAAQTDQPKTQEGAQSSGATDQVAQQALVVAPWSKVEGVKVQTTRGDELGDLDDFVMDPSSGELLYAVISRGGVLGVGDELYAVPMKIVKAVTPLPVGKAEPQDVKDMGKKLHLQVDTELATLKSGPTFPKDQWPDLHANWENKINEHYGTQAGVAKNSGPRTLARVSKVDGEEVVGIDGKEIGNIDDLVLDTANDRIVYASIGSGGFLEMGEKHHALPWSPFQVVFDEGGDIHVKFPTNESMLAKAPVYDKDRWSEMSDPQWIRTVYTTFSAEPYWSKAMEAGYQKDDGQGAEKKDEGEAGEHGGH